MVVLMEHHVVDLEVLCFKKFVGSQQDGHKVIGSDQLSLCQTPGIQFLLDQTADCYARAKGHAAP